MKEEIKAGIIIVASLVILSAFIILVGGGQLFEKVDKYSIKVMNAAGLETGAQVKLGGVRVGRVLSIKEPTGPREPVTIEIGLKKGTVIYKGTRALITQIGFVGDLYLLLAVDKTTSEKINPGGDIPSEESVDFGVLMSKIDGLSKSADDLLKDADKLFSPENVKRVENLVENTNKAIVSTSGNIEKVTMGLRKTTDKIEVVLNEIEGVVKDNKGEFSKAIKKAREDLDRAEEMIKGIEKVAKSVDKAVDVQSQNLDNLLGNMTRTTEDLQEVIQELKHKPWSVLYKENREE